MDIIILIINISCILWLTYHARKNQPKRPEPCQTTEALLDAAREGIGQTLVLIDNGEYEHAYRHLERIQDLIKPIEYGEQKW